MTAARALAGMTPTATTRRIVALADEAGLRPHVNGETRRGLRRVFLDAGGIDGLFGAIDISEHTGRIVRAFLTHGNAGTEQRIEDVATLRAKLASWAAIQRIR